LLRYAGMVDAVTIQDLQDTAQKYLDPDAYALAVAGPASE
jgi:predicted Zn-dependent peptidase